MISEQHPDDKQKRIKVKTKSIDENLKADSVRKKLVDNILGPEVNYIGYQGSTLTLMGIVSFDKEAQELILEKTAAFFSGGLSEAKSFLSEAIKLYRQKSI